MKSKYLEEYIKNDGCCCEENCLQLFLNLNSINNTTNYNDVISIIMPKFMKYLNENKDKFLSIKTTKQFELIDRKYQTYKLNDSILEPFEEGYLINQVDVNNYINYLDKISNSKYDNISINENKFERFPYIKDLCQIDLGYVFIYENNQFIFVEYVKELKNRLNNCNKYICLSIMDYYEI